MKLHAQNPYHNTEARAILSLAQEAETKKRSYTPQECYTLVLRPAQRASMSRRLCGVKSCTCIGTVTRFRFE